MQDEGCGLLVGKGLQAEGCLVTRAKWGLRGWLEKQPGEQRAGRWRKMKSEGSNGQLPQWVPLSSGPFSTEIQVEPERSEPFLCSESPGDSQAPPQGGSELSRSRQGTAAGVEGLLHASILTCPLPTEASASHFIRKHAPWMLILLGKVPAIHEGKQSKP